MADYLAGCGPFVVGEVALAGNLARLAHCRASQFPPTPGLGAAAGVGQGRLGLAKQAPRGDGECVLHHRQRTLAIGAARRVIYSHFGGGVGRRPRVLALPVRVGLGLCGVQVTFGALQTRRFRCGHEPDATEVGGFRPPPEPTSRTTFLPRRWRPLARRPCPPRVTSCAAAPLL